MNTDWSQFWPSMIATLVGALLGFAFAIAAQKFIDWCKDRDDRKSMIAELNEEFQSIIATCRSAPKTEGTTAKGEKTITVSYKISPIKTPRWTSYLNANKIQLLSSKPWYVELFKLYGLVQEYNQWYELLTKAYFNCIDLICENDEEETDRQDLICKEIARIGNEIVASISTVRTKWGLPIKE